MSDQYYTPIPEDFRRGFEFEMYHPAIGQWSKEVFDHPKAYSFCCTVKLEAYVKGAVWAERIRVSYLTAEQIEAEGCQVTKNNDLVIAFTKGHYVFQWGKSSHHLMVLFCPSNGADEESYDLFKGYCRCGNDFRLICKLLNIK